jgi:hypothetical protein
VRLRRSSRANHDSASGDEFRRRSPGWARIVWSGLDAEALDLLRGEFCTWRDSSRYDPAVARRFLEQLLAEVLEAPELPEDPWSLSPSDREEPLVAHCETSYWVVAELLELGVEPVMERWLYWIVTRTPLNLVPAESMRWAFGYASRHDLDPPWL